MTGSRADKLELPFNCPRLLAGEKTGPFSVLDICSRSFRNCGSDMVEKETEPALVDCSDPCCGGNVGNSAAMAAFPTKAKNNNNILIVFDFAHPFLTGDTGVNNCKPNSQYINSLTSLRASPPDEITFVY